MKMYFSQKNVTDSMTSTEDYAPFSLKDSIEKTRRDLADAYAGFDNAVDTDLIDSYIYEIIALQKRYKHLTDLAALETTPETTHTGNTSRKYSPVRALVSHVLS